MNGARRKAALPPWPETRPLRAWQTKAIEVLAEHEGDAFLASATPAAGKTTFGLRVAYDMLSSGAVQRVAILAPTAHICRQWAADAARYGMDLEPNRPNAEGPEPSDRDGVVVTYQAVAAGARPHRTACNARRTLLIADEPHHMGEHAAWGATAMDAFAKAQKRLLLSGTPFRSDNSPIPWVEYDADGVSAASYSYSYTQALVDGVCRPITFQPYDGDMEWTSDGRRRRADFSVVLPRNEDARRLRTALDGDGDWIRRVLIDADAKLGEIRGGEHPDAGGLVIAMDKQHAFQLAAQLERISGETPMIVTSDEVDASQRIARFAASTQRWIVSVLMVSEGVDIPRLRVGVYATSARTELFFRQVVGRFIRRSPRPRHQMSFLFLPSDILLKTLASRIEEERNHAIELKPAVEDGELDEPPERRRSEPGVYEALYSDARPDEHIQIGENMMLFGEPEPAAAARPSAAFMAFGGGIAETRRAEPVDVLPSAADDPTSSYQRREKLREERSKLVATLARRRGEQHREINARINRAVGAVSVGKSTLDQLERANERLRREVDRGR
ncbi:DEAD/DEAH box helicase [Conexibacter woesei]|uniref:DEAD-like helicase n=1 Tax=Conexibacter woesei (strain DSM 14684 / CCUG 47730 / CIP 108061 / JCM 11494 / NBRC 100937 / ID131577) TaxID=469383 RepID=D3F8U4_CONWI|nr:DEAD/DEAH box helicase family protein [Conexibacter woesei]ADB52939.1 DEAD-like helicase [Conexibacter woesei DSM 14684]